VLSICVQRRDDSEYVCNFLAKQGFPVRVIHGEKGGAERDETIEDFRNSKFTFLVATNVIGRGLDVVQVSLVVNLDLPRRFDQKPDAREFIHRVGRAGRVDRKGVAICFTDGKFDTKDDIKFLFDTYKQKVNFKEIEASDETGHLEEIFKFQQDNEKA
jgi:superfamily II DNA/RNA helicase